MLAYSCEALLMKKWSVRSRAANGGKQPRFNQKRTQIDAIFRIDLEYMDRRLGALGLRNK